MKKGSGVLGAKGVEKSTSLVKKKSWEDEWEDEIERKGTNEMIASVIREDEEVEDDEEERESIRVEDEESEIEVGSLQEVKNLILHQLVISYNLSKVTQHVVDRVLNHLSREEKMERSLRKVEEVLLDVSDRVGEGSSTLLKVGIVLTLILQVLIFVLLILRH